jgi:hypothetical protein
MIGHVETDSNALDHRELLDAPGAAHDLLTSL